MNKQELISMLPTLRAWIEETLADHVSRRRTVASYDFNRLSKYYTDTRLNQAKVVEVDLLPVPPLRDMGLAEMADFEEGEYDGITFLDTYFVKTLKARDETLHFHELIHVIQWDVLGLDQFLLLYAQGYLKHGYRDSPLEAMACKYEAYFENDEPPCDIEPLVRRGLAKYVEPGATA